MYSSGVNFNSIYAYEETKSGTNIWAPFQPNINLKNMRNGVAIAYMYVRVRDG